MSASIAIWSNKGMPVAFAKDNGSEIYHYHAEQIEKTCMQDVLMVQYDPGCHRNSLKELRKSSTDSKGLDGIFIQKQKTMWTKVGTILWADVPETGLVNLYIGNAETNKLATNKRDALTSIGYTKQIGKGTGNLMMGVCRIVSVN